jgi:electron transport complex protein RnfA
VSWIGLLLTFALVENVVLVQMLGVCPCVGAPRRMGTAVGIGIATVVMMSLASLAAWAIRAQVLVPLGLEWLQTAGFVVAIAALALLFEAAAGRFAPGLLRAAGFSARGVGVNCAVLGAALIAARAAAAPGSGFGPLESLAAGFSAGCGVLLVLVLLSAIRAKLDTERVPVALRGLPISLISAGLLALAFLAFDRALIARLLPMLGLPS